MADKWQLIHPNHINAIVDGYEATIEHFRDRVGFTLDRRIPDSGDGTDACLMTLGGVMFEFFAPKERGERGQGRLLARYGDHYVGIEYHVPDVTSAREFARESGIRIINDLGAAFFTYPGNSFGIAFEIYDGDFRQLAQPARYWETQHPLGLTGLARLSVAVESVALFHGPGRRPGACRCRSGPPFGSCSNRPATGRSRTTSAATVSASAAPCSRLAT